MSGLMKGFADGMQDSRSRDAESSAASANFRALDVESKAKSAASSAEGRAEAMLQGLSQGHIKPLAAEWGKYLSQNYTVKDYSK